jgi:hypothetical protein
MFSCIKWASDEGPQEVKSYVRQLVNFGDFQVWKIIFFIENWLKE